MTTTLPSGITLTDEQQAAVDLVTARFKAQELMTRIGGYAGTGKTTLIQAIRASLNEPLIVCAYTGKAASVLRSKGIDDACTIHSCIYKVAEVLVVDPVTGKKSYKTDWVRKSRDELTAKGFIIDEASMVGKELLDDLQAFGLPLIAVGDPGQLPPISRNDVNLMERPDFVLERIHRQAAESGIIRLATRIRTEPGYYRHIEALESEDVYIASKGQVRHDATADAFICGFNKTRVALNMGVRQRAKRESMLEVGERIICLGNDRFFGLFNGLMGVVKEIHGFEPKDCYPRNGDKFQTTVYRAMVHWDGRDAPNLTPLSTYAIAREKPEQDAIQAHYASAAVIDYGYAITCHKSQGSQFDRVVVINESAPKLWSQERWLYTAVTRAAKTLALGHENA